MTYRSQPVPDTVDEIRKSIGAPCGKESLPAFERDIEQVEESADILSC